jgi:adenosylhomocysteine nucleosidase
MMLRYLVNNWVRQAARKQLMDTVSNAAAARSERTGQSESDEPPPPCRVLVTFALDIEAGGFVDLLQNPVTSRCATFTEHAGTFGSQRIAVLETGVGHEAAMRAVADAYQLHRPKWVLSAGFAGALVADLRRGHMLMANRLLNLEAEQLGVGLKLDSQTVASNPSLHTGSLLTVDQLIRTTAEKEKLAGEYGAVACDMESFAIAELCRQLQTRFLSVRIISDSLSDELPKEIERLMEQTSTASKLGAAAGAVFHRPSSVLDMWKLKEDAIKASDRLARFLTGVLPQLD